MKEKEMNQKESQYTVITGASSGIGYAVAKAFADRGKNLILVARRQNELEKLKEEILQTQSQIDLVIKVADLSVREQVYRLYEELKKYDIRTWINNAGIGDYQSVGNQELSKVEQMLALNVEALTILSSCYVRDYQDVEGAQLINVSSAGGYTIVPNAITYCGTKFYVSAFTEGLARELRRSQSSLQAKVLAPAATETEFGKVAAGVDHYDYNQRFGKYHTSSEIAGFLLELYDSQACVGQVNRNTFEFTLSGPVFTSAFEDWETSR